MRQFFKENKVYVLVIILTVIAFNVINVFWPVFLIGDDGFFYHFLNNSIHNFNNVIKSLNYKDFSFFGTQVTKMIFLLTDSFSIYFGRGIYLLFMVIASLYFYRILRFRLHLSQNVSMVSAVIPNILPYNFKMPGYIVGSYLIFTLMMLLLTLDFSLKYLENKERDKKNIRLFFIIVLSLGFTMSSGQALFLFPVIILLILVYQGNRLKKILLLTLFSSQFILKFVWMLVHPRVPVISQDMNEVFHRIYLYFKWGLPFPFLSSEVSIILFFIILLFLVVLIFRKSDGLAFTKSQNFIFSSFTKHRLFIIIFFAVWAISTVFANMFLRKVGWQFRFCYASYFGFFTLFALSLYSILGLLKNKRLEIYMTIILILISGIYKISMTKTKFDRTNELLGYIKHKIAQSKPPKKSQFIIILKRQYGLTKNIIKNSGVLQYALGRKDITGNIASDKHIYYGFTRHFVPFKGNYVKYMNGYNLKKPLFIYRFNNGTFKQYHLCLEWLGEGKGAEWVIYKLDKKTGANSVFLKGKGLDDYFMKVKELEKKGIEQDDIVFGESTCVKDLERLKKN
ncbi:MAG: hypothetical protein OEZ36_06915 [Spirochaetota bacterium]|nr:hypothetical protein [Spirochaetota bacterium]